eukprot:3936124-Rhodomonas_salina.1
MELAEDGSVDKAALLTAIRNVSFEGASGRVQYDMQTGERDTGDQVLRMSNIQQVTGADGSVSLAMVPVWRLQAGVDGEVRLERAGNHSPVWPGGEQGWELPFE